MLALVTLIVVYFQYRYTCFCEFTIIFSFFMEMLNHCTLFLCLKTGETLNGTYSSSTSYSLPCLITTEASAFVKKVESNDDIIKQSFKHNLGAGIQKRPLSHHPLNPCVNSEGYCAEIIYVFGANRLQTVSPRPVGNDPYSSPPLKLLLIGTTANKAIKYVGFKLAPYVEYGKATLLLYFGKQVVAKRNEI